jgi:lysophospholipase L1-like esterase
MSRNTEENVVQGLSYNQDMFPKRIIVIGASSAEGQYDPEHGGWAGLLYRWHEGANQRHHVYNLGISGDNSSGMAQRLTAECKIRKPHLIICQVGANDSMREGSETNPTATSLEAFEQNIRTIIAEAKSLADVMFISIFPIDEAKTQPVFWGEFYYSLKDIKAYTDKTKQVCEELNVPYIDIFNKWISMDYAPYLHSDGLHANSAGHQFIFEQLRTKIISLYQD